MCNFILIVKLVIIQISSFDNQFCIYLIYLNIFVESYSPPTPVSMIATSTFSRINIVNAIIVKNTK